MESIVTFQQFLSFNSILITGKSIFVKEIQQQLGFQRETKIYNTSPRLLPFKEKENRPQNA